MAKSAAKRWLFRISLLLLAVVACVLALPTILGAKWIYDPIVKSFAKDKLRLEIASAKLAWFQPLELHGLEISDIPDSGQTTPPLLSISSIKTDRGLFSYLLDGRQLGRIEIQSPRIDVALLNNESNVQRLVKSLKQTQPDVKPTTKRKLDVDIVVKDVTVQVTKEGLGEPLVIVPPFRAQISYHSLDQEPTLRVSPTKILDQVVLTPELVALGLGHAAPFLAKSAWFDGRVSLDCGELTIPLEHPIDSVGTATLTMHEVRTGPSEPLVVEAIEFLSQLRDKQIPSELVFVNGSRIDVEVKDQSVTHRGLEAGLPKLDERLQISSAGSVGLIDEQLNLLVELPVPIEQIARRDSVKELGVPKLKVPVRGTLKEPAVDWASLRKDSGLVLAMMAGQLQGEAPITSGVLDALGGVAEGRADDAIAAAADLFQEIRERRKQKSEQERNTEPQPESDEPKRTKRPLLDALRRSIRP